MSDPRYQADGQLVIEEDGKLTIEGGGAATTQCSTVYVLSPAANPPPPASADGAAEARIAATVELAGISANQFDAPAQTDFQSVTAMHIRPNIGHGEGIREGVRPIRRL